jgi:glyoxylase-like metal-dependent hydrolase (beta-lactamase superfamily II)
MAASTAPLVHSLHHADTGTWTHVVADPATRDAAIIDPVLDYEAKGARTGTASAQALLELCAQHGYQVKWILETHAHADHLSAAEWLQARTGAPVGIGAGIRAVQATFKPIFGLEADFATDGSQFDRLFADGERFALGALEVEAIATPGHTSDSMSYRIGDAVFVGDSLFMPDGGTARCDFPGGDAQVLYASIQRLYALPDDTRVFVCHDYGPGGREPRAQTTIAEQKAANIHVRADTPAADFVALRGKRDATLALPALILPAVQVNIRGGRLPPPRADGRRYLSLPLDTL